MRTTNNFNANIAMTNFSIHERDYYDDILFFNPPNFFCREKAIRLCYFCDINVLESSCEK